MKPIIIVYNREERRYFARFDGPVYIEVDNPCGVFYVTITEQVSQRSLEIEICMEYDDVVHHVISLEETKFDEEIIDLIYDTTENWILNFLSNDDDVLFTGELIMNLREKIRNRAREIAKSHPSYEAYKQHVETVDHSFCTEQVSEDSDTSNTTNE